MTFNFISKKKHQLFRILLVFFLSIFCITIKNLILLLQESLSIGEFLIIISFPIATYLFLLLLKKSIFFHKLLVKIEEEIDQFPYFNKHTLYLSNAYMPKIERFWRPFLSQSPYVLLYYFTFYLNKVIIIIAIVEMVIFSNIKIALFVYIFSFFLFRILKISLKYILDISKNSVNHHFHNIWFLTYLRPVSGDIEKENLFRLLDEENLKRMVFIDRNYKNSHLMKKFFIIESILHFSRIYFVAYSLNKYLFTYFRFLNSLHLFFSIFCLLIIETVIKIAPLELIPFFLIDFTIFIYIINNYCYQNFIIKFPFFEIQELLIKLTQSLPDFWIAIKEKFVEENFLSRKDLLTLKPYGIYIDEPEKPSFFEGFQDIPLSGNPSLGFSLKKFLRIIFFISSVVCSYLITNYFLTLFSITPLKIIYFIFLILSLLKQIGKVILILILCLFK